ncbi:MAG: lipid-A-disaccharide synthase, partial [Pseudomonadota bacterium]
FPFILSTAPDEKSDAFNAMDIALSCSGTVTTELALQNTPMIVAYKIGWFSWALARAFLMKSKYITLLNVAAGAEIAPEFVQTRMTIDLVSDAGEKLLSSQGAAQTQIDAQNAALEAMGRGRRPAAEIAAETVLQLIAYRADIGG